MNRNSDSLSHRVHRDHGVVESLSRIVRGRFDSSRGDPALKSLCELERSPAPHGGQGEAGETMII